MIPAPSEPTIAILPTRISSVMTCLATAPPRKGWVAIALSRLRFIVSISSCAISPSSAAAYPATTMSLCTQTPPFTCVLRRCTKLC